MFKAGGVIVLAIAILSGCGKREMDGATKAAKHSP